MMRIHFRVAWYLYFNFPEELRALGGETRDSAFRRAIMRGDVEVFVILLSKAENGPLFVFKLIEFE